MSPGATVGASGSRHRPRLTALRNWPALLVRAGKSALDDDVPLLASALAFNAFLAIPATLLLVVGLFSLVAEPSVIEDLMERLATVVPAEAVTLVEDSLLQLQSQASAGLVMTVVGLALAVWTTTGAMSTVMTAVNRAHGLEDTRGFVTKRLVAVALVLVVGLALVLVGALLVLGPHLQRWIGSALDGEDWVGWAWWTAEWPILVGVLFVSFSAVFALSKDHSSRRWRLVSPGAGVAVLIWLAVSSGFALYASRFGSYNKTWGSLSAVIVTLVWLWLSGLALLYGSEVDAEWERSRARVSGSAGRSPPSPRRPET
jgi:membrane protein